VKLSTKARIAVFLLRVFTAWWAFVQCGLHVLHGFPEIFDLAPNGYLEEIGEPIRSVVETVGTVFAIPARLFTSHR
jgi:hypothetical protein